MTLTMTHSTHSIHSIHSIHPPSYFHDIPTLSTHHHHFRHLNAQLLSVLRTLQQRIQRAEVAALCGSFQVTLQATQLASLQLLRLPLRDAFLSIYISM